jgi:hypothetical protein
MNLQLAMSILYPLKDGAEVKELNRSNEIISLLGSLDDIGFYYPSIEIRPGHRVSYTLQEELVAAILLHETVTLHLVDEDANPIWFLISTDVDPDECIICNHSTGNYLLDEMVEFHADQFCS